MRTGLLLISNGLPIWLLHYPYQRGLNIGLRRHECRGIQHSPPFCQWMSSLMLFPNHSTTGLLVAGLVGIGLWR